MTSRSSGQTGYPLIGNIRTLATAGIFLAGCTILPLMIGYVSAKLSSANSLQLALVAALLFPAFLLALLRPRQLVAYTLLVWAIAPELRLIADWSVGAYHSVSLLSLAPLLAGATVAIPVMREIHKLQRPWMRLILLFALPLGYATLIGLAKNGVGSVYDLMNYLVPLLLLPYFAITPFTAQDTDRLLRSYAAVAVLVAAYGIVQYTTMPPWDAFWMQNAGMNSIGSPKPLEVRVFSTLNSPGPAATFLVFALVPMILEKKWRGIFGWVGVLLVVVCLLTTLVRAAWLILLVMLLAYIASSSSKGKWKTLIQLLFVAMALYWIVPKLPGAEVLTARMETFSSIQEDRSYNDRLNLLGNMLPVIKSNPVGQGIGSVGQSTKLGNGGELGEYGIMDNGFIALMLTFGAPGVLLFSLALGVVIKQIVGRILGPVPLKPYARLALASWIGVVIGLVSDNGFSGIKAYLVWMLIAIGLGVREMREEQRKTPDREAYNRAEARHWAAPEPGPDG